MFGVVIRRVADVARGKDGGEPNGNHHLNGDPKVEVASTPYGWNQFPAW